MEIAQLKQYFKKIMEGTNGNNSSCSDIIDYANGNSITIEEIKKEYYNYKELENNIDNYIEENDLDDVLDRNQIKEHFKEIEVNNLFRIDQACLENFVDYMIIKINKENENIRKANIIFNKNGNGFLSTKITLPVPWVKELNFSENDKTAIIKIEDNKIIIEKENKE